MRNARLIAVVVSMVVAGCGGFDPEYYCEQDLACEGGGDDEEIELCSDLAEVYYDHSTDKEKEEADDAHEACKDKKSCEYLECTYAERAGLDTDNLSKAEICGNCTDTATLDACNQSYDICTEDSECSLIDLALAFEDFCSDSSGDTCGDDYADDLEDCDGSDLWGEDCDSVTLGARPNGTLTCNANCTFNVSFCTP